MNDRIYSAFLDELDKIATVLRVRKGGGRHVSASPARQHKREEGYDPKALFQSTEGSEAAREQAEEFKTQRKGEEVKSPSGVMGVSGAERILPTILERRRAEKAAKAAKAAAK